MDVCMEACMQGPAGGGLSSVVAYKHIFRMTSMQCELHE